MMNFRWSLTGLCLLAFLLPGCGGGSAGPQLSLAPVTGTVMADGEPLANAMVMFAPYEGDAVRAAYGVTDQSGKYELLYEEKKGCPPGKYRITISKFAMPDGSLFPRDMPQEEQMAEGKEHVPAKFSDPAQTKLFQDVTADGGEFPLEISLK